MTLVANRELMIWPDTAGKLEFLRQNGNKITQAGLFFFMINADGTITDTLPANAQSVAARWPHVKWLLTIRNDGFESRIRSILTNPAYENTFIARIGNLLDTYPWATGIDVDIERSPNDLEPQVYALYQRIYDTIKAKGKWVHLDLPPMTAPHVTLGPETWCDYAQLVDRCDSAQIMAYGFAWTGSGVGSAAPIWWAKDVMDYAVTAFPPAQVFMGCPAYGHRWQIHNYPGQPDVYPLGEYRGVGAAFDPFLEWMLGDLSHTDVNRTGTETQKYIPFASFWDAANSLHYLHLHIYDYPGAGDQDTLTAPMVRDNFDKDFLTCYGKRQRATFTGTEANLGGEDYTTATGAIGQGGGAVWAREPVEIPDPITGEPILEEQGSATYDFSVSGGTYEIVVSVLFPWWNRQTVGFTIDGASYTVGGKPQWYPYHRAQHWISLGSFSLSGGTHTLVFDGADSTLFTNFYGFRVCDSFSSAHSAGRAAFTMRPRQFYDKAKALSWPYQNKFKVTLETLRRDPEHVTVWYDDFRDWTAGALPDYYNVISGTWTISKDPPGDNPRPYSWVTGSGRFNIDYSSFSNLAPRLHLKIHGAGKAGVVFGNLWLAANTAGGTLELYEGAILKGSHAFPFALNTYYTLKMRVRGTEVSCYIDTSKIMTVTATAGTGTAAVRSDVSMTTDLFVAADAYWLQPQEAFDVLLPGGATQTVGRIPRTGVTWNTEFDVFRLDSGEDSATRSDAADGMSATISMEWDYLHSQVFTLAAPGNYPFTLIGRDIGAWCSTVFMGDADGFSLCMFPGAESILRFCNIAAYDYRAKGVGLWNIGLEDPSLWDMLPIHS